MLRLAQQSRKQLASWMGNVAKASSMAGQPMTISEPHFILKTPIVGPFPEGMEQAVFGTGCFWGSEKSFWRMPGMYTTAVVYAGGKTEHPTYEQVCSGASGHTEAVLAVWDPSKLSFADVMRQFLQSHDPTQKNGQGNDRGTQYRGAFYFSNEEQRVVGEAAIKKYEEQLGRKIQTEVRPMPEVYYAEQYHQQYLARPGSRPYCSAQPQGVQLAPFAEWCPTELQEKYAPKLPEAYWDKHAPKPHCVLREPHAPIEWPSSL